MHILSRLNVTIKADENLVAPANNVNKQKIVMTSLVVKNLNAFGKFSEATDPVATGTIDRWDEQGTPRDYTAVASNNYKGISVLDDNGNLRSTYDIKKCVHM